MKKSHLIYTLLMVVIAGIVCFTSFYTRKPVNRETQDDMVVKSNLNTMNPTMINDVNKKGNIVEETPIITSTDIPNEMDENITSTPLPTNNINNTSKPDKVLPKEDEGKGGLIDFMVLKDKIICIDPGHQRKNNNELELIAPTSNIKKDKMAGGTSGVITGIPEYRLNLMVSEKLVDALGAYGATVVTTRSTDDVNISNIERAKFSNNSKADIIVRIHADGSENPAVKGLSILYPGSKYIKDNELLEKSKRAASKMLESLITSTGANSRGIVARNDLTGFNWSTRPVILIEMGFMTNKNEDKLLSSSEYQEKIVDGIIRGLVEYFND